MSKIEELFKEAGVIRLVKTVLHIGGQEDILVKKLSLIKFGVFGHVNTGCKAAVYYK